MNSFKVTRHHVLTMARSYKAEAARNEAAASKCRTGETFERNTYIGLARDARIMQRALAQLATVGSLRDAMIEIKV